MNRDLPSSESLTCDYVLHLVPGELGKVGEVSGSLMCFGHPDWGSQSLHVNIPVRIDVSAGLTCGPAVCELYGDPTDEEYEEDPPARSWSMNVKVSEPTDYACGHWPCFGYEA